MMLEICRLGICTVLYILYVTAAWACVIVKIPCTYSTCNILDRQISLALPALLFSAIHLPTLTTLTVQNCPELPTQPWLPKVHPHSRRFHKAPGLTARSSTVCINKIIHPVPGTKPRLFFIGLSGQYARERLKSPFGQQFLSTLEIKKIHGIPYSITSRTPGMFPPQGRRPKGQSIPIKSGS